MIFIKLSDYFSRSSLQNLKKEANKLFFNEYYRRIFNTVFPPDLDFESLSNLPRKMLHICRNPGKSTKICRVTRYLVDFTIKTQKLRKFSKKNPLKMWKRHFLSRFYYFETFHTFWSLLFKENSYNFQLKCFSKA